MMTKHIFCITGQICAGKDLVGKILQDITGREIKKMSGLLTELLKQKGVPITRDSLYKLGVTMSIAEKAQLILDSSDDNIILTGIRTPATYKILQKKSKTTLIAVLADQDLRYQRILKRNRSIDNFTYEKFLEIESRENQGLMNVNKMIETADVKILNNQSIQHLNNRIQANKKAIRYSSNGFN